VNWFRSSGANIALGTPTLGKFDALKHAVLAADEPQECWLPEIGAI
jgi:hypothetical protein